MNSDSRSIYEYDHKCPKCGKEWTQFRLEQYKKNIVSKTCPNCLGNNQDSKVQDLGGLLSPDDNACKNCKHFEPLEDKENTWGECGKDKELDNEQEYTLSWAINNITGCMVDENEYDNYGQDVLGLVYSLDVCGEWQEK